MLVCLRGALAVTAFVGIFVATLSGLGAIEMTGVASFYGERHHGRRTASGERFDQRAMTAAHRSLPFDTRVRVCRADGLRRCVVVRINDRGPFVRGRIIDLSTAAAHALGMGRIGVARVRVKVLPSR